VLTCVAFSAQIYLFFTFTGLRSMLFKAVPKSLRASICVGIGARPHSPQPASSLTAHAFQPQH
jgi:hypothetical protein